MLMHAINIDPDWLSSTSSMTHWEAKPQSQEATVTCKKTRNRKTDPDNVTRLHMLMWYFQKCNYAFVGEYRVSVLCFDKVDRCVLIRALRPPRNKPFHWASELMVGYEWLCKRKASAISIIRLDDTPKSGSNISITT